MKKSENEKRETQELPWVLSQDLPQAWRLVWHKKNLIPTMTLMMTKDLILRCEKG